MPVVRTVRSRGATIVVEAHAEVLFTRNGPVGNFARTFSNRARSFTAGYAPGNSRPTWGHEPAAAGRPLKSTFKASTRYVPSLMRVFSAVGSTANYSAFVDQGTGIYNGGSPWKAKILPPTSAGGSDLYEHTWRYSRGPETVREVWIKGQKPQHFFAHGLEKTFRSMRIPSATVPGTAVLGSAVDSFPDDLANFAGATIGTGRGSAFRASLEQWREQRDLAWGRNLRLSNQTAAIGPPRLSDLRVATRRKNNSAARRAKPTQDQIREAGRKRQQRFRDHDAKVRGRANKRKPPQQTRTTYRTAGEKNSAALAAFKAANPQARILREVAGGIYYSVNGQKGTLTWAQLYGLL